MLLESFVRERKELQKWRFHCEDFSPHGYSSVYVCLCFRKLPDSVGRSAALLLAFVTYLPVLIYTMVKNVFIQ